MKKQEPLPLHEALKDFKQAILLELPSLLGTMFLIFVGMLIMLCALLIEGAVTWSELWKA